MNENFKAQWRLHLMQRHAALSTSIAHWRETSAARGCIYERQHQLWTEICAELNALEEELWPKNSS